MTDPRTAAQRVRATLMSDDPAAYTAACWQLWRATRVSQPVSMPPALPVSQHVNG